MVGLTSINDAIYSFNTCTQTFSSYVNGVGTNGGGKFIPSGQGFYVESNAASPVLSSSQNVIVNRDEALKSVQEIEERSILFLTLNGDQTALIFDKNSTLNFDGMYDAKSFYTSIYSSLNGADLSINSINELIEIPIMINGEGELMVDGVYSFKNVYVYIRDNETGELIDPKITPTILFENSKSTFTNRFTIVFENKPGILDVVEKTQNNLSVYPNPVASNLEISSSDSFNKIEVYNVLGALVKREVLSARFLHQLDFSSLNNGSYIVKIYSENIPLGLQTVNKVN